jgi:hypothetical protein
LRVTINCFHINNMSNSNDLLDLFLRINSSSSPSDVPTTTTRLTPLSH